MSQAEVSFVAKRQAQPRWFVQGRCASAHGIERFGLIENEAQHPSTVVQTNQVPRQMRQTARCVQHGFTVALRRQSARRRAFYRAHREPAGLVDLVDCLRERRSVDTRL